MGRHSFDDERDEGLFTVRNLLIASSIIVAIAVLTAIGYLAYTELTDTSTGDGKEGDERQTFAVEQGAKITSVDKDIDCRVGLVHDKQAWIPKQCGNQGETVSVDGVTVGVVRESQSNGVSVVELYPEVDARNDFDHVDIAQSADVLKFSTACAIGRHTAVYGCGLIRDSEDGGTVASVKGIEGAPWGTPVWVRSSLKDEDTTTAYLLGIVTESSDDPSSVATVALLEPTKEWLATAVESTTAPDSDGEEQEPESVEDSVEHVPSEDEPDAAGEGGAVEDA